MKSYNQSSHYGKYRKRDRQSARSSCVTLTQHIITLCFTSPLLALNLPVPKSCTEAITHVLEIVTYHVREKGMECKGEQR